jgi:RimJ/RimL family protein N-acetyltransferase
MSSANPTGQPLGPTLPHWQAPPAPPRTPLPGRYGRLEPLSAELHAAALYEANAADSAAALWTYLPYGPFATLADYRAWLEGVAGGSDPQFFAILDEAGRPAGVASYLRIDPRNGCIEVGHLAYSPRLQRSRTATEAMYLLMRRAFELGYRRYEWKCNALNAPSCAAALRLGFTFEGIFRQAVVVKGRNRDTAWYSIIDSEWPALRAAFETWLAPGNFDAAGHQRLRLGDLTAREFRHG